MTTRQTAAFAAILLVGCGNPQPPTVEDFTEAAQPIPTPEPQTATIETPDVPLWEAARIGNIEAVRLHLAGGMDANAKDESGWAPLHGASGAGQREIVELLLANGAKVNVTALSGKTALDYASRAGHKKTADLLLQHGGKTRSELKTEGK